MEPTRPNETAASPPPSRFHCVSALCAVGLALAAALGCGGSSASSGGGGASTSGGAGGSGGGSLTNVRGGRYCEILIGKLAGSQVHVEVFNTYPLDDCPQAEWAAVDVAKVKSDQMADAVILNGPRYWTMDAFQTTSLIDPTPLTIGGIQMHLAGTLDLPLSVVKAGEAPYSPREVNRTTTWVYDAGKPVYELVDPMGRIFDMQSYSVQKTAQTEASLPGLGAKLMLPSGWKFQSRTLAAALDVAAVNQVATVVQDELGNTYQLSQQTP